MPLILPRPSEPPGGMTPGISIGVVNNLSDAGLETGERQFVDLLRRVADIHTISLRFFTLPSIVRGPTARMRIASRYTSFEALKTTPLDALIITGCEPRMPRLPEEAFWPELTEVIDWAEHNTRSTILSCLAAHAAVLHLDGIERRPIADKLTGLFAVEQVAANALLDGAPLPLRVPHSRWNGLDEATLTASGYEILTRGPEVGVDTFLKSWGSLFIYLHGHPEYDPGALGREYRRDVMRYLQGTSEIYPTLPIGYFGPDVESGLDAFAARAKRTRDPALAAELPLPRRSGATGSGTFAATLVRNWLHYLQPKTADHAA